MHTHINTHTYTNTKRTRDSPPPPNLTMPVFSNDKARLYLKSDSVARLYVCCF